MLSYFKFDNKEGPLTRLLCCHTILIVAGKLAAIEKLKLWIVLLLLFGNCFELWSIASHKFRQFVYNVA